MMEVNLPAFDRRRYNARLNSGHARDNHKMMWGGVVCGPARAGVSKPALIRRRRSRHAEEKTGRVFADDWAVGSIHHSANRFGHHGVRPGCEAKAGWLYHR